MQKKKKWLSEEALQIAEKRRKVKSRGEKERYTHLIAEFLSIGRTDKKVFLSDQCKKKRGKNRMGKSRDLFKKIKNTKGTFHAKMGTIKDRNGMDLTEAEDIKKRWQEYTEELHKKYLQDQDMQMTPPLWQKVSSVTQSGPTLCDPHESQHARPPCPSPTPGVHSDSRPRSP